MSTSADDLARAPPIEFLAPNQTLADLAARAVQLLFTKTTHSTPHKKFGPIQQLATTGLDQEQVWQQLDLRNRPLIRNTQARISNIKKRMQDTDTQKHPKQQTDKIRTYRPSDPEEEEQSALGTIGSTSESDPGAGDGGASSALESEGEGESETENKRGFDEEVAERKRAPRTKSIDKLMEEMNEFADEGEDGDEGEEGLEGLYGDDSSDEELEGEDDDNVEDEDGEDEVEKGEESTDDFEPHGTDVIDNSSSNRDDASDGDGDDAGDGDLDDFDGAGADEPNSHDIATKRLKKKLSQLERAQLAEKPWQFRGEVGAQHRPENSLLETVLDFDQVARPSSMHDESTDPDGQVRTIEEVIIQRIKDNLWDDVVRQEALRPGQFRSAAAEISTDKSEKGLAEEYESEYAKEAYGASEPDESSKSHVAAQALLAKLTSRLDALYSFHFAPKPPKREKNVRANTPAVTLEDRIPTTVSTGATVAPEEIHGSKRRDRDFATRAELSQTERQAHRQTKKRVHKRKSEERAQQQRLRAQLEPDSMAARKLEAAKIEEDLKAGKRRGTIKVGPLSAKGGRDGTFSKSAKFFSNLQASVDEKRKSRSGGDADRDAKKLRL